MQLRDQVLIPTGVESGSETGVAGDRCSWWHCHCLRRETFFLSTLSHPQMSQVPFWWQAVSTFRHFHPRAKENDPSPKRQGRMPFLAISPLFLCPLRLDLILFLSDPQIDENLSSSPSLPEPQTVWPGRAPWERCPQPQQRGALFTYLLEILSCWQETPASDFNSDK